MVGAMAGAIRGVTAKLRPDGAVYTSKLGRPNWQIFELTLFARSTCPLEVG
jgi:hypothetical protein